MAYIHRTIEKMLLRASHNFPALILTGPRRSGKTTVLKRFFGKASYYLLEDPDIIAQVKADPRAFLDRIKLPVILDEIQNVPELLNYIRTRVDGAPRKTGQWFITGSQEMSLMKGVSESMAGGGAIFYLLPFSIEETEKVSLICGAFPEVISRPAAHRDWFRSYIQTYLERDVRSISSIRNLSTFRRFLALLASRTGQVLNKTDLAAPLGVSIPTIAEWLNILEVTAQIILVPPFYENFGKRLIKSPKIYFMDSGLICYLLGIETEAMLHSSPFFGPIFESFVASEIVKHQVNHGKEKALYYFRDQQGLEVDFVVSRGNNQLILLEAKASKTVWPGDAAKMLTLRKSISKYSSDLYVIHLPSKQMPGTGVVNTGVGAIAFDKISSILSAK